MLGATPVDFIMFYSHGPWPNSGSIQYVLKSAKLSQVFDRLSEGMKSRAVLHSLVGGLCLGRISGGVELKKKTSQ